MSANNKPVISASAFTDSAMDEDLRSTVNQVLLSNNCIPQIHATLLHECQASGFVEQVRTRALDLLRTGKATSFSDCMEQIMEQVKIEAIDTDATGTANGSTAKGGDASERLVVPKRVVKEGFETLQGQLEMFLDFGGKGEGSSNAS